MSRHDGLRGAFQPDWRGLVDNIMGKGTPKRVHHVELFQDYESATRSRTAST